MADKSLAKMLLGSGTALNLFGDVSDAEEAWRTAKYNSHAAQDDAESVEESGAMNVRQFERQGRQLVGSNLSSLSASNTAYSGSAMDIMADTLAQLELEKRNKQRETALQARSLRNEASNSLKTGAAARSQGYLKASGSLLKSANDLLSMF
jgi:hypothetical protein